MYKLSYTRHAFATTPALPFNRKQKPFDVAIGPVSSASITFDPQLTANSIPDHRMDSSGLELNDQVVGMVLRVAVPLHAVLEWAAPGVYLRLPESDWRLGHIFQDDTAIFSPASLDDPT